MLTNYLFVCGCGRSGTSVLARLLGAHDEIIMGMERFGHLVQPGNFSLTPSHFEEARFLKVEEGDTFYNDFNQYHAWDSHICEKFQNFSYIGDKRPDLFYVYNDLFSSFKQATIIFIYRDVFDVATSWNKRAKEGIHWPKNKNYKKAVVEWGNSLKLTIKEIRNKCNIICLSYEDLFVKGVDVDPLYKVLGLSFDTNSKNYLNQARLLSVMLAENRKSFCLSEKEKSYVRNNAEFRYEQEIEQYNFFKSL